QALDGARRIAHLAVAGCSLPRLSAACILWYHRGDHRSDGFGGGFGADRGISAHRFGQPSAAGRAGGEFDDVVDLDWTGGRFAGSQSALPSRSLSHSTAKVSRADSKAIAIVSARARDLKHVRWRRSN